MNGADRLQVGLVDDDTELFIRFPDCRRVHGFTALHVPGSAACPVAVHVPGARAVLEQDLTATQQGDIRRGDESEWLHRATVAHRPRSSIGSAADSRGAWHPDAVDAEHASRLVTDLVDAGVLVVFVPLLFVAAVLAGPVARRTGSSRLLVWLALVSIAGVLAATLRERDLLAQLSDAGPSSCAGCVPFGWLTDPRLWSRAARIDAAWLLNVALFIPAGLLVTLATRRPARVLITLVGLALSIEVIQDLTRLGSPDPADLVANSVGASIGVGLGIVALRVRPARIASQPDPTTSRRAEVAFVVGAITIVSLGWLGLSLGADARLDSLKQELREAFVGSTAGDIESRLASAEGFDEILASVSVRPGYLGRVADSEQFEGRYATQFFGLWRCAYIRWTADGFGLRDASGDQCTVFREGPPTA